MSRQEKKAQSLNIVTGQLTPEAHASVGSKECSASTVPISESTCLLVARHKATTAIGAASVKQRQPSVGEASPGITHYGSAQSSITWVGHTLVGEPNTGEDVSDDWLHRNPTYVRGARSAEHNSNVLRTGARSAEHNSNILQTGGEHGQYDFVPTSFIFSPSIEPQDSAARYEMERIRKRTKYSEMSMDQKYALLYRVREYKKRKQTTCASSDQYDHAVRMNTRAYALLGGIHLLALSIGTGVQGHY
ncbi:uncharacterized protein LOC125554883 [Triticum urartu]|uniref:uncharacterized protein LOC125554883 n=1 Tax=Triticum urartu TaxID=4572 RepID=UPI002042CE95|nr:uncharacterized protein LOC125554883 [Triticum urartu]